STVLCPPETKVLVPKPAALISRQVLVRFIDALRAVPKSVGRRGEPRGDTFPGPLGEGHPGALRGAIGSLVAKHLRGVCGRPNSHHPRRELAAAEGAKRDAGRPRERRARRSCSLRAGSLRGGRRRRRPASPCRGR